MRNYMKPSINIDYLHINIKCCKKLMPLRWVTGRTFGLSHELSLESVHKLQNWTHIELMLFWA